jgi:dihydrofolate synthase/folylpolyglutamate synthase
VKVVLASSSIRPPPSLDDPHTVRATSAVVNIPAMEPHTAWIESLSPWPEEFGLGRMHDLLEELGHPERAFPSVHVVGTNGKSTATRAIAQLLRTEGLRVGAYTSPHVSGWGERLDTDADGFERAVGRIRPAAERVGATQFEALTAAAFAAFAAEGADVAAIEAGLGGRLDATNVLDAPVVHLTNVSLEHTDVLGDTREAIAREKLAVGRPGAIVVLGEPEWAYLLPEQDVRFGGAQEAAEAFLGRSVGSDADVQLPGRLEWRGESELWDGAHTPEAVDWLLERLPEGDWTIVLSLLKDKDADEMLERLARVGQTLVATQSSSPRALPAVELADRARRYVSHVVAVDDPATAVRRAHELGPRVLVTGSLYLLADLHAAAG